MTAVGALVFPSRRSRRGRHAVPEALARAAADAVRRVRSLQQHTQQGSVERGVDVGGWGALSVVVYRDADANAVTRLAAALGRLAALVVAGRVPLLSVRGAAVEATEATEAAPADLSASAAVPWLEACVLVGSHRRRQHVWQLQLYTERRTQVRLRLDWSWGSHVHTGCTLVYTERARQPCT